jgi:YHS domain-containing protein
MTILGWIVRLLLLAIVLRLVLRAVLGRRGPVARRRPAQPAVRQGGTLERDPHCGTYVPRTAAITAHSGAETLYFCSTTCRDAYAPAGVKRAG